MNHPLSRIFLLAVLAGCLLSASGQEQSNLPVAMRQLTQAKMATGSSTDSHAADYGHMLLDALHATDDTYYYTCARKMGLKSVGGADLQVDTIYEFSFK